MKETIPGTAIVLAAGLGSRLAKISPGLPKALISVGGQPIINYALNAIAITSIETVAVVVSSPHNNVQQHVYSKYKNAFALRFPVQQPANGPGDALLCALVSAMGKKELEDGTLVLGCDYKLPVNYVDELMAFHGSHKSPISISARRIPSEDVNRSSLTIRDREFVLRIIEKPNQAPTIDDCLASTLIYILPRDIARFLKDAELSCRGEIEIPDAINAMIASGWTARWLLQPPLVDWQRSIEARRL